MSIPTYTPGYPPDGSSLGQTKVPIRNNLDGTFQTLAIDHVNNNGQPGSQPAGYHTIIHEVPQTSVSTVSGYNQVFSGVPGTLVVNAVTTPNIPPNGDTQLYSLTGMGGLSQLTGNHAAANGYCWVGGILIQWGKVSSTSSGNVLFNAANVNFQNNCFSILTNPFWVGSTTPSGAAGVSVKGLSPTGFQWVFNTNSSSYTGGGFYWLAIGN